MNRLRQIRELRGATQDAVAAAVGVSRQTIISIERGRYTPRLPLAFALADFLASSVDELFRERDEAGGPEQGTQDRPPGDD